MGEEVKKPEEKKPEEGKKEEAPAAEKPPAEDVKKAEVKKSDESKAEEQPPPPQEIVLKVFMHCEGCARKVRRCLKGFEGVEDVITDCRTSKVVVKGEKADPVKVLERVQMKSHRQVDLISPIPKPPVAAEDKKPDEKQAAAKPEEKKEEPPVITVVLGVYMHCEACAQEIKKRIQRMKGVESAEPDLKSSQVAVKGVFEPEKLADYIHKRTGKHAVIVKVDPEKKKEEEEKPKEEKKLEETESNKDVEEAAATKENKEPGDTDRGDPPAKAAEEVAAAVGEDPKLELRKNEFNYYYPQNNHHHQQVYYPHERIVQEYNNYAYPPQMFSDENPNACSVM